MLAEELTRTAKQAEGPFYPDKLPLDTDNDLIIVNDAITPAVGPSALPPVGLPMNVTLRSSRSSARSIVAPDSLCGPIKTVKGPRHAYAAGSTL